MKKVIILCIIALSILSCSTVKDNSFSLTKEINKDLVEAFGNDSTIYLLKL